MSEEPARGELAETFELIAAILGDDEPYWTLSVSGCHYVYEHRDGTENTFECTLYLGNKHHRCTGFKHAIAITKAYAKSKHDTLTPDSI